MSIDEKIQEVLDLLLSLLREFEGCVLHSYQDDGGVWTIGFGETLGVGPGMVWTREQAEERLRLRAAGFLESILKDCPQLLQEPKNRVAACGSLTYNIGKDAFHISSVRRLTQRKEYLRAADSFLLWNKVKGRVNQVLVRRRKKERALYLSV